SRISDSAVRQVAKVKPVVVVNRVVPGVSSVVLDMGRGAYHTVEHLAELVTGRSPTWRAPKPPGRTACGGRGCAGRPRSWGSRSGAWAPTIRRSMGESGRPRHGPSTRQRPSWRITT